MFSKNITLHFFDRAVINCFLTPHSIYFFFIASYHPLVDLQTACTPRRVLGLYPYPVEYLMCTPCTMVDLFITRLRSLFIGLSLSPLQIGAPPSHRLWLMCVPNGIKYCRRGSQKKFIEYRQVNWPNLKHLEEKYFIIKINACTLIF